MTEYQFYHQQINLLRLEYEKAIKLYLDRLAYLKKIEPPKPICVTLEQTPTTPPQSKPYISLIDKDITSSYPYSVTRDKGCFLAGAMWANEKLRELNEAANGIK